MICPLSSQQQMAALEKPLIDLVKKCRMKQCYFVDSDHDSDYLPANCVLIVVAMLNKTGRGKKK